MNILTYDFEGLFVNEWAKNRWSEKLWEWKELNDINIKVFDSHSLIGSSEKIEDLDVYHKSILQYKITQSDIVILALNNPESLMFDIENTLQKWCFFEIFSNKNMFKIILTKNKQVKELAEDYYCYPTFSSLEELEDFIVTYLLNYETD